MSGLIVFYRALIVHFQELVACHEVEAIQKLCHVLYMIGNGFVCRVWNRGSHAIGQCVQPSVDM